MKQSFIAFGIVSAVGVCISANAHADTETSCNSLSTCLSASQTGGGDALLGSAAGTGTGVHGSSTDGFGVFGMSSSFPGVYGTSTSHMGVQGDSSSGIGVYGWSNSGNGVVGINPRTDWNAAAIAALPGNSNGLAIYAGGGAQKPGGGSWTGVSDARVKKDVKDFRAGLAEVKRLRPVSYKYNGLGKTMDDGNEFVGLIAQELEKVLPSMVASSKVKLHPEDDRETDLRRIDPSAFTYVLINAVQEQQKIIERQEARIAKLEHGDAPSLVSFGGLGSVLALGLVPLGLLAVQRRRRESWGGQA